jgi:hypothetical protein
MLIRPSQKTARASLLAHLVAVIFCLLALSSMAQTPESTHVALNALTDMRAMTPAQALSLVSAGNTLQVELPAKKELMRAAIAHNDSFDDDDFTNLQNRLSRCNQHANKMDVYMLDMVCMRAGQGIDDLGDNDPRKFELLFLTCYWGRNCETLGQQFLDIGNLPAAKAIWTHAPGCHSIDAANQPRNDCATYVFSSVIRKEYDDDPTILQKVATFACRNETNYYACLYLSNHGDTTINLDAVMSESKKMDDERRAAIQKLLATEDAEWQADMEREVEAYQANLERQRARERKWEDFLGAVGTLATVTSASVTLSTDLNQVRHGGGAAGLVNLAVDANNAGNAIAGSGDSGDGLAAINNLLQSLQSVNLGLNSGGTGSSSSAKLATCQAGAYSQQMRLCQGDPVPHQASCYLAASDLCQCYIDAYGGTGNLDIPQWEVCVANNKELAKKLLSNSPTVAH